MYHHLTQITDYIDYHLAKSKHILVHCNQGKYRSTAVILAYLYKKIKKQSFQQIYKMFQLKYPIKNIDEHLFRIALKRLTE